jgi:alpha-tubulin suppressor-like RCC1 family protein
VNEQTVSGGFFFDEITSGSAHTCGRASSGDVYCWGRSDFGETGISYAASEPIPKKTFTSKQFVRISAGARHTCGIQASGDAWCWGSNSLGQLGDGTQGFSTVFMVKVAGGHSFTAIAGGGKHTCGLTSAGKVYCWGDNTNGQLGDGTFTQRLVPTRIAR